MTCKDCLHNEVCEAYSPRDTWATQHCAEDCVCFADRSEWVHLPCKVGDKAYFLCRNQETYEWYICEKKYTQLRYMTIVLISMYRLFAVL